MQAENRMREISEAISFYFVHTLELALGDGAAWNYGGLKSQDSSRQALE